MMVTVELKQLGVFSLSYSPLPLYIRALVICEPNSMKADS
jgi:hypothetical protein